MLSAADIGVTDAYVQVRTADGGPGTRLLVSYAGAAPFCSLDGSDPIDTLLRLDSLKPAAEYSLKVYRINPLGKKIDSSAVLTFRMMDTTSHNFTFRVDTLGDGGNSILRDVAIINDTFAIAVGELHYKDANGRLDPVPYSYATWNGREWTKQRPVFVNGPSGYTPVWYTVWAFSERDIWASSTAPAHWNGHYWEAYPLTQAIFPGYPAKLWGTSSSNLFIVGTGGSIAHWDGRAWTKMACPVDVDLKDITGTADGSQLWASGYYDDKVGTYILSYTKNDGRWKIAVDGTGRQGQIARDSLSGWFVSVQYASPERLWVGSPSGLYQVRPLDPIGSARRYSYTDRYFAGFPALMRGTGVNDLWVCGDFYFLAHFNGRSMQRYAGLSGDGNFTSVDARNGIMAVVGYTPGPINGRAIVVMKRR